MMIDTSPKYSGEPTAEALANGLATLGRYGDNYMVHAAEGETVVPKEILEANPGLKEDLFRQMTMMGIEDPNRYVVGSELNSINPITGQPEFFFKKVFRAIKKVAKKILPIAAPIIGNIIAPGIGGIVASGLTTKLMGGSWGDALKSAALSYGASALGSGIMGGFNAPAGTSFGEGFTTGLGRGLTAPFSAASNLFSAGPQNPLAQGVFGPRGTGTFFSDLSDPRGFGRSGIFGVADPATQQSGIMDKLFPSYQGAAQLQAAGINPQTGAYVSAARVPVTVQKLPDLTQTDSKKLMKSLRPGAAQDKSGLVTNLGEGFTVRPSGGLKVGDFSPDGNFIAVETLDKAGNLKIGWKPRGLIERTVGSLTGSTNDLLNKGIGYGALGLGGYGLASATGMLDTPEDEEFKNLMARGQANSAQIAAYQKWLQLADKNSPEAQELKLTWYGQPAYTNPQLAASFGAVPAASGGEIVGPGTGTSDSIPARLSDGEFVMTARAVRNAGGGDRNLGAARMYDMMNRFERGVA
jgi:hypothetical protein